MLSETIDSQHSSDRPPPPLYAVHVATEERKKPTERPIDRHLDGCPKERLGKREQRREARDRSRVVIARRALSRRLRKAGVSGALSFEQTRETRMRGH